MEKLSWEFIKKFYSENFGIDGWVVELYANLDVLILCASGTSNDNISKFTEISKEEVQNIIKETFDFDGWNFNLPTNPYHYYCSIMKEFDEVNKDSFLTLVKLNFVGHFYMTQIDFDKIYDICKLLWEIESKITDEWI